MTRASHPRHFIGSRSAQAGIARRRLAIPTAGFLAILAWGCVPAAAQSLLGNPDPVSTFNLLPGDAAVLEMEEVKHDLPCTVTSVKPMMGSICAFTPDTKSRAPEGIGRAVRF